jgi:hypothetical protein
MSDQTLCCTADACTAAPALGGTVAEGVVATAADGLTAAGPP